MEIKYHFVLYIGIAVLVFMTIVLFVKRRKSVTSYSGGKKIADLVYAGSADYFKKRKRQYTLYLRCATALCMLAMASCFLMMSKPYMTERVVDEKYSRDIILCIDISTSVDYLNANIIEKLKSTVDELDGERFGIVIFNTSPVMLTPLTDDYEYVKEQLDIIEKSLEMRSGDDWNYMYSLDSDWMYYYEYVSAGTLVGNEERGSSLIGDGLAAAACDFSDMESDKDRTRVVIFSTDNDIQGIPIVTLDEAADVCVENKVTVYGIGTKEMTNANEESMREAVEKTGGDFFLEEESGSFEQIVSAIEKQSASLVKTGHHIKETAEIGTAFVVMLLALSGMFLVTKILKL